MNNETLLIQHGKCLTESGTWQSMAAIYVQNGRILAMGDIQETITVQHIIDASDCLILPGLTDLSVALREPGNRDKGTIASETAAAAAGGITTLCCPPDTQPVNDSHAVSKLIGELAHAHGKCRVKPLGAMTKALEGEQLAEYASLKRAGCVAVSNAYFPLRKLSVAKRCFEYAKTQNLPVFVNPIEPSLYRGSMHEGIISTTIGLQGVSSLAETIAVAHYLQLAAATGVKLHLSQLSCADSVHQLRRAKAEGLSVSADVALQNLLYTDEAAENFNSVFHTQPPLRAETDRIALLEGVRDGTLDAVTSAHRPHEAAAKLMPFGDTEPGMSLVEHVLSLGWQLDRRGELPFARFIAAMNEGPSDIIAESPNRLKPGAEANLVVFDPQQEVHCTELSMLSTGKNSPLLNQVFQGGVKATLLQGALSFVRTPGDAG